MFNANSFQQVTIDDAGTQRLPAQNPMTQPASTPPPALVTTTKSLTAAVQAAHAAQAAHTAPATAVATANPFADPTALGLMGLAIGCASLLPVAFGVKAAFAPDALRTAAWFCLLFGAGCQFLAGMMSFANKNGLGGTLLTAFSFNWVMNWWGLSEMSQGRLPSESVILAVDCTFLVIFLVMTVAFGFFSKLLFAFLVDIVALYVLRIARSFTHSPSLGMPIALATALLMVISLYIAFSLVLQNASGRVILPIGGPLFKPAAGAPPPSH
jgi:succinate-acetate transporter protein